MTQAHTRTHPLTQTSGASVYKEADVFGWVRHVPDTEIASETPDRHNDTHILAIMFSLYDVQCLE